MSTVRRMRHWKQRFAPDASFIWNKPVTWQGEQVEIGKPIPKDLASSPNRLRRFWEARVIQLADFSAPDVLTGKAAEPSDTETDNQEPEGAEALVSKVEDRKWSVEGLEAIFPTKKAAVEAAQATLDENEVEETQDDEEPELDFETEEDEEKDPLES